MMLGNFRKLRTCTEALSDKFWTLSLFTSCALETYFDHMDRVQKRV